ncbi:MAG: radical SAM protein [Candidatus Woesearchaeota archaeon]
MKYSDTEFDVKENKYNISLVEGVPNLRGPLNIAFQVTRRCNLKCIYCSEPPIGKDMPISDIEYILDNMKDARIPRVNITGGEVLMRKDIVDIIDMANNKGFKVGMDSNSVLMTKKLAESLAGKLVYYESTVDGAKENHNRVRGEYDKVINGIELMAKTGTPTFIAMVLLGNALEDAKDVMHVAHNIGASHIKYLTPIPKARGKLLPEHYLNNIYLNQIESKLRDYKSEHNLSPKISIADWKKIGKGPVFLLHNDGTLVSSPAMDEPGCVYVLGNALKESIASMWDKYPYKQNHIDKYTGKTMVYR